MKRLLILLISPLILSGCGTIQTEENELSRLLEENSNLKVEIQKLQTTITHLENEKTGTNSYLTLDYGNPDDDIKRSYFAKNLGVFLELPNDLPDNVKVIAYYDLFAPRVEVVYQTDDQVQLIKGYAIYSGIDSDEVIHWSNSFIKDLGNSLYIGEYIALDNILSGDDLILWNEFDLDHLEVIIK